MYDVRGSISSKRKRQRCDGHDEKGDDKLQPTKRARLAEQNPKRKRDNEPQPTKGATLAGQKHKRRRDEELRPVKRARLAEQKPENERVRNKALLPQSSNSHTSDRVTDLPTTDLKPNVPLFSYTQPDDSRPRHSESQSSDPESVDLVSSDH